jgi:hypothetical protein
MLSFIIPARSQPVETRGCLISILNAVRTLRIEHRCEFILLDDQSDPKHDLAAIFREFRANTPQPVTIGRFRKHQHYTGVFAYGLSKAQGQRVLFISNDMIIPAAWLRTLLAVSTLDPSFGVVRGTADLVDSHPEHSYLPPTVPQNEWEVEQFADYMAKQHELTHTEDNELSGDAVLINRALLDRIGVFDRRFFGYFSDLDFGLRAQRAGFKLICAKGAWLRHIGAGHIRADRETLGITQDESHRRRMALVQDAYALFRQKWDTSLPEQYRLDLPLDMNALRQVSKPKGFEFVPPIKDEPNLIDLV